MPCESERGRPVAGLAETIQLPANGRELTRMKIGEMAGHGMEFTDRGWRLPGFSPLKFAPIRVIRGQSSEWLANAVERCSRGEEAEWE